MLSKGCIIHTKFVCLIWFMVFNATVNNISVISWQSVLLVDETEVPGENHWHVASHWQVYLIICIEYTSLWNRFEITTLVMVGTDCSGSFKSNYHTIMTNPVPTKFYIYLFIALSQLSAPFHFTLIDYEANT
jgi:hypothetical protein